MKYLLLSIVKNRTLFLVFFTLFTAIILSLMSPYFLTTYNITQILHFISVVLLISLGQNLVILTGSGGIDLSIGSVLSLSGVIMGLLYHAGMNLATSIIITLLISIIIGSINGFNIVFIKMPPLIATLGALYMYGGLSLLLAKTGTISGFPENFSYIGQSNVLSIIPAKMVFIVIPIFIIILFIVKNTEFGRGIYLIGINEKAATFAGIKVKKIRFMVYVISALLAAISAILMTSYLMVAKSDVGKDLELQSIIVVMLAGTSSKGGIGKVENIIFSALIITMLSTGLQLAQINAVWQMGILGVILILTTLLNNILEKSN